MHQVFHARDGHAVAERTVSGGVRRTGQIGPIVRIALLCEASHNKGYVEKVIM